MEILCLRNMSGRIKPALNDIASLDATFRLNQIIVMHHSNCGSTHCTIDQFRNELKATSPNLSSQELEAVIRGTAMRADNDGGLKDDLRTLRDCKFIRKELAEGAIGLWFDVETGRARQVKL
jgi:carbonic anhydrase